MPRPTIWKGRVSMSPEPIVDNARLRIVEEPSLAAVSIRKSRRMRDVDALALPSEPNVLSGSAEQGCVRFEPHAWLLTSTSSVLDQSRREGRPTNALMTDVSDRLVAFRISGPLATDVIAA